MASLHLIITVLLNAIATISSQCPQDSSAQDILCTVSRNDLLPPPTFALVHCETDRPGGLLLKQADALRVDNTRWRVDLKACFFRHGDNCTHLFIRIDSPPTQQQVEVCRIQDPTAVCTCIDLTEPTPPTTTSYDPQTTTTFTDPPTTTTFTDPPTTTESSSTTQIYKPHSTTKSPSTTSLPMTTSSSTDEPAVDNMRGGVIEELREQAGFVAVAGVTFVLTIVIAVLSIALVATCWHKNKSKILIKDDVELAQDRSNTMTKEDFELASSN